MVEITVFFYDKKGQQVKDSLTVPTNGDETEEKILTWASDLATEWFYNIAYEAATVIWNESGGGTDYEFESFYEKFVEDCNLEWEFKRI